MEKESVKEEIKCGTATWFNALGTLTIIAGVILSVKFGIEESSFLLFMYYLLGGLFLGLLCFGFAKIVNAAHKYLNSHPATKQ